MSATVQAPSNITLEPALEPFQFSGYEEFLPPVDETLLGQIGIDVAATYSNSSIKHALAQNIIDKRRDSGVEIRQIQSALIVTQDRSYQLVKSFPVPQQLGPQEVMIRNHATGLNHIDWKSVDYNFCLPEFPWITGREMAGVVESVGAEVKGLKKGDHVWTSTYYKDRRAGCFQDFVTVPQHTVLPVPSNLDFNSAACLGVAGLTAAMSLWKWLGVPMYPPANESPGGDKKRDMMLVWGGSTATGQFATQLASYAGMDVIAVCSESTAELVSSLGAAYVVTYTGKSDFHVIGEILCLAQGRLTKAVDLVGANTVISFYLVDELSGKGAAAAGQTPTLGEFPGKPYSLHFNMSNSHLPQTYKVLIFELLKFLLKIL